MYFFITSEQYCSILWTKKKKFSTEVLYIPLPEHYLMFSIFVKYIDHLEKIYKRIPVKIPTFFIQLPASFFSGYYLLSLVPMSTYLMYLYFTQNIVTRGSHVQIPSSTGMGLMRSTNCIVCICVCASIYY